MEKTRPSAVQNTRKKLLSKRPRVPSHRKATVVQAFNFRTDKLCASQNQPVSHNRNSVSLADKVRRQKYIEKQEYLVEYKQKLGEDTTQLEKEIERLKRGDVPRVDMKGHYMTYVPYDRLRFPVSDSPACNYYERRTMNPVARDIRLQKQDSRYVPVPIQRPQTCQTVKLIQQLENGVGTKNKATIELLRHKQRQEATQRRLNDIQEAARAVEQKKNNDAPFLEYDTAAAFNKKVHHGRQWPSIMGTDRWHNKTASEYEQVCPNTYKPNYYFGSPRYVADVRIMAHARQSEHKIEVNDLMYDYKRPISAAYAGRWDQSKQCQRNEDLEYQKFLEQIGEM